MEIKLLEMPELQYPDILKFIYEVRKQIEMQYSLPHNVLGIDKVHPTASEVLQLLKEKSK